MDSWFFLSFFFPADLLSGIAGPEETKNQRGKCPPPDSNPFSDAKFGKNPASVSRLKASTRQAERCRKLVYRRLSQPQISRIAREDTHHYTPAALLIIEDHLRHRFAPFNLRAHLLDLRCLLFHRCSKRLHSSF